MINTIFKSQKKVNILKLTNSMQHIAYGLLYYGHDGVVLPLQRDVLWAMP